MNRTFKLIVQISVLTLALRQSTVQARKPQSLPGHIPKLASSLTPIGRVEGTNEIHLAISLPLRNADELQSLLEQLYNPESPNFRRYLSAEEFARRFGPTADDYASLVRFAQTNQLTVTALQSNNAVLGVSGLATAVERAFHTRLLGYPHPSENRTFYAPSTEPSLDLAIQVLHVQGLDNLHRPEPMLRRIAQERLGQMKPNDGTGTNGSYLGKDFRAAYAPGISLTGSGQILGLVEFDGYYANDIALYLRKANLAAVTLQNVLVGGFNGHPGSGNGEVALDIQMAIAMAPGLAKILVYEEGAAASANTLLNKIATDNTAKQISCSWTWGTYDPGTDQIFKQFAAQGQSFLQASGDSGAFVGAVDAPVDNPYITVVGGTTLTTSSQGVWMSETAWNDGFGSATGGGSSTLYSLPTWQAGLSMSANSGSTSRRNVPDVAMIADNVESIADNGATYQVVGTSIAAPLWAGFIALANQRAAADGLPTLGFLNPALYTIGGSANYLNAFHDITSGDNTTSASPNNFPAVANYDLCTGWGTPKGANTLNFLIQVANNQLDHFSWGAIGSPVTTGNAFAVALTARNASGGAVSNFTGAADLSVSQTQTNLLFSRDFETGTLSDWTSQGGSYTRAIDTTSGAAGTKQSLELIGGDGAGSYNGLSHSLPNLSPDRVEFYVKSLTNTTASGYVVAGASKYRTNSVFHFRLDSSGGMGLTDGPGNFYSTPYSPNRWYKIGLQLNWTSKTIDYYVDDRLVLGNIPFCNPSLSSLVVINLYNFDNTKAWWDQIRLLKNTRASLLLSPASAGPFNNGVWTGTLTLSQSGTNLTLTASDTAGHRGDSNPLDAVTPTGITLTVVANPSDGGTVSGSGTYAAGAKQTISALPNANWAFVQWQDGNSTNPRTITVPATNVTYTASFAELPIITVQPSSQIVNPGDTAVFTIVATGPGPLSYLWRRDGSFITPATSTNYTLLHVLRSDSGSQFSCIVSNAAGVVGSQSAKLTVRPAFAPASLTVTNHVFRASAQGDNGSAYVVEVSTNLLNWSPLSPLQFGSDTANLVDTNAIAPYRYYRISGAP